MKLNKIDSQPFGTKPLIGDIAANNGLRKYRINLTKGIFDAYEQLAANNIGDQLNINIGHKRGAKRYETDVICISRWIKDGTGQLRLNGSVSLSPKTLEKLSKTQVSKLIMKTYEKLKVSTKNCKIGVDNYASRPMKKVSKKHAEIIKELIKKYGFDDWTCA